MCGNNIKNIDNKKIISLILVFVWLAVIFFMSNMKVDISNNYSKKAIEEIAEKPINSFIEIEGKINSKKKEKIIDSLNRPIRKIAHVIEFLILALLVGNFLVTCNTEKMKIIGYILAFCCICACFDEYHQTFVDGRTGQFIDIFIDSIGAVIGCIVFKYVVIE